MKKKNLFFSLALLSAMGGLGSQMVFAEVARTAASPARLAWTAGIDSLGPGIVEPGTGEGESPLPGDTIPSYGGNDTIPVGGDVDGNDYTSFIQNPGFENADSIDYWGYSAAGRGTLPIGVWRLDYDVNGGSYINLSTRRTVENPQEGEYYMDCWAGKLKALDLYQILKGLPAGYYRLSAALRNIDADVVSEDGTRKSYLSDQHVYTEVEGLAYDSPVMTEAAFGSKVENWETLSTAEFLVADESTEVRIGVRSTGNGTDPTGWFQADNFRLERVADASPEDVAAYWVNRIEQTKASVLAWAETTEHIQSEAYSAILDAMNTRVEEACSAVAGEDISAEQYKAACDAMNAAWETAKAGESLVGLLALCEADVAENSDEDFSAAIAVAQGVVAQAATNTVEIYGEAFKELQEARYSYIAKNQNPGNWDFSESGSVEMGTMVWNLNLDTNHKVACITGLWDLIGDYDAVFIEVPERVSVDGIEYTVVGLDFTDSYVGFSMFSSVKLPSTLRFIGNNSFSGCMKLQEIEIPALVDSIGDEAFYNCTGLWKVVLPNRLKSLGIDAFSGCTLLSDINLSEVSSLEALGNYAFSNCRSLKNVTIPAACRSIGNQAFYGCSALSAIEAQDASSLVFIGNSAFRNCKQLRTVSLPASIVTIGEYAFNGCSALSAVEIPDTAALQTIGSYAFQGCTALTAMELPANVATIGWNAFDTGIRDFKVNAMTPPGLSFSISSNLYVVRVPKGAGTAYRATDYWKDYIIMEGEGTALTINVDEPGTLGEKILAQTNDMVDVNYLTLSGELNDDDTYNIQNRLVSLLEIDMKGVKMEALPASFFYQRHALQNIVLPEVLKTIGSEAFYQCYSLPGIELPASLETIGDEAFRNCTRLDTLFVPDGVTSVGTYAFYGCSNLWSVVLPPTLKTIEASAFRNCTALSRLVLPDSLTSISSYAFEGDAKLTEVVFPSTLQRLESYAFSGCTGLTAVTLPEAVNYCQYPFSGCSNLKTVTCNAFVPPYLENGDNVLNSSDLSGRTLYVPSLSLVDYKLTTGWDVFGTIEGTDYLPGKIDVFKAYKMTVPDTLPASYKPDVSLAIRSNTSADGYGNLTVKGGMLSMGLFGMSYDPNIYYDRYSQTSYPCYNALVNEASMRADSVKVNLYLRSNKWTFLSFPYDVKVADIAPLLPGTSWVIRKYDGEARAAGKTGQTWLDMTADSTLQAGTGYIWQCAKRNNDNYAGFAVPAVNNTNKNLIFANEARTVALADYPAEFSHNRSWNLVGNPFPCFYDTRRMEFAAPITVWNEYKGTYEAYSLVDDEYILRPGEAFFVQRPVDSESIAFPVEGRQVNRVVKELPVSTEVNVHGRAVASRDVFNLTLEGAGSSDRTRFVLNENATKGYDMAADAGKFMSTDMSVPQLYTLEGGVAHAINERPTGNGLITLGTRFGQEGTYTLSLDTKAMQNVVLVDKVAGKEVDLREGAYAFHANAGTADDRFLVKVSGGDVTSVSGAVAEGVQVAVSGGKITVQSGTAARLEVYTADGRLVGRMHAASASFEVAPGVYIVIVNGTPHKVAVDR